MAPEIEPMRLGLRIQDIQTGVQDVRLGALAVDIENIRMLGMAERLAVHIRGTDVIDDEKRLKYIAAQFGEPAALDKVLETLQDLGWIRIRGSGSSKVIEESVPYFTDVYAVVGDYYKNKGGTEVEDLAILTADSLAATPSPEHQLRAALNTEDTTFNMVKDITRGGGLLEEYQSDQGETILYSPAFWSENPQQFDALYRLIDKHGLDSVRGVFDQFRNCQGSPLPNGLFVAESGFAATENQSLAGELVSAGMLLAPQVDSSRGVRHFGFTPHAGIQPEEKTVLEKAMAILACVRYGEYFGSITRIKFPDVILDRISRSPYRIGPHSEIRQQYSLLALRGIGKVFPSKTERGRFYFELLPTEENLRAVQLARDLLLAGEAMETKVVDSGAQNLLFASGTYEESTRTIPKVQRQAPVSRKTKEAINTIVLGLSDEIRKA